MEKKTLRKKLANKLRFTQFESKPVEWAVSNVIVEIVGLFCYYYLFLINLFFPVPFDKLSKK